MFVNRQERLANVCNFNKDDFKIFARGESPGKNCEGYISRYKLVSGKDKFVVLDSRTVGLPILVFIINNITHLYFVLNDIIKVQLLNDNLVIRHPTKSNLQLD